MARPRKKVNNQRLLWLSISAVVLMALILTAVFLFMKAKEPEILDNRPNSKPPLVSYYNPDDFVLDENGFMTCLYSRRPV